LVTVITFFFKISAHTTGTAGVLGCLIAIHLKYIDSMLFWPIVVALVLHGIVSSARLYLNTHDPKEVYLGAVLGFVVNFGAIYLLT
jgi:membrane-associated phospholipid phosphatase